MTNSLLPSGIVGVVRTRHPEHALTLALGWLRAGVPGIEITTTVPDAAQVIAELAPRAPGRVGAGTVRTTRQAEECVRAGAAYLVAPNLNPAIIARAAELAVPMVPGTLTPSEMAAAAEAGAAAVKVFPVGAVGGVAYLKAIREPLSELRVVASGGIAVQDVTRYLAAGAYSVCLGAALTDPKAVERGDVDGVARFAALTLARSGSTPVAAID